MSIAPESAKRASTLAHPINILHLIDEYKRQNSPAASIRCHLGSSASVSTVCSSRAQTPSLKTPPTSTGHDAFASTELRNTMDRDTGDSTVLTTDKPGNLMDFELLSQPEQVSVQTPHVQTRVPTKPQIIAHSTSNERQDSNLLNTIVKEAVRHIHRRRRFHTHAQKLALGITLDAIRHEIRRLYPDVDELMSGLGGGESFVGSWEDQIGLCLLVLAREGQLDSKTECNNNGMSDKGTSEERVETTSDGAVYLIERDVVAPKSIDPFNSIHLAQSNLRPNNSASARSSSEDVRRFESVQLFQRQNSLDVLADVTTVHRQNGCCLSKPFQSGSDLPVTLTQLMLSVDQNGRAFVRECHN